MKTCLVCGKEVTSGDNEIIVYEYEGHKVAVHAGQCWETYLIMFDYRNQLSDGPILGICEKCSLIVRRGHEHFYRSKLIQIVDPHSKYVYVLMTPPDSGFDDTGYAHAECLPDLNERYMDELDSVAEDEADSEERFDNETR